MANEVSVSVSMTIVMIFIAHSCVNCILLSPWNPLRGSFFNLYECSKDEDWMMNWLAFGRFHVLALLICLARASMGSALLEGRLLLLCCVLMLNYISTGVFMVHLLNKPMAVLQCIIYFSLLAIALHNAAISSIIPLPSQLRSSSFDARRKLPLAAVALAIQFVLSMMRVSDMTLGSGREAYNGDSTSVVYQSVSHASVNDMLFAGLILGIYFLVGTVEQQKALLVGQTLALFVSQAMLAGSQGDRIDSEQVKAGGVATFFSILISMLGLS